MEENKDTRFSIRLSKRQSMLLSNMSRQQKLSKAKLVRRALFNGGLLDEPDYTTEDRKKDAKTIEETIAFIEKNIRKNFLNLPFMERESILSKLAQIKSDLVNDRN